MSFGFVEFLRFIAAFICSFLLSTSVALADPTEEDLDWGPDIYEVQLDKTDYDTLGNTERDDYPSRFRCQLIVVIVNLSDNFSRQRMSFWGEGSSWGNSRNSAFQAYGRSINTGGFWRSNYNHSFAFQNCQG